MGVFSTLRRRRLEKKAVFKAAKVQAKATAKATAKQDKAREKYLRRTAGKIRSIETKAAKRQDRKDVETAKALVARAKSKTVTAGTVLGWVGAARVIVPVAVPLAYRALAKLGTTGGSEGVGALLSSFGAGKVHLGADSVQRARITDLRNRAGARNVPDGVRSEITRKLTTLESTLDAVAGNGSAGSATSLAAVTTELDALDRRLDEATR